MFRRRVTNEECDRNDIACCDNNSCSNNNISEGSADNIQTNLQRQYSDKNLHSTTATSSSSSSPQSLLSSKFSLAAHRDLYGHKNNKRQTRLTAKRQPTIVPYLSRSDVSEEQQHQHELAVAQSYNDAMDAPCCRRSSSSSSLYGSSEAINKEDGYGSDGELSPSLTRSILQNSSDNLQGLVSSLVVGVEHSLPSSTSSSSLNNVVDHQVERRHHRRQLQQPQPSYSWKDWVGYITLGILLVVGLSNTISDIVNSTHYHNNELDSTLAYDALSTEVLSPPFRYNKGASSLSSSSSPNNSNDRKLHKRSNLGTAAISSITETLTPILPFMGGADLRKEEHWDLTNKDGWLSTIYNDAYDSVRDVYSAVMKIPTSISFSSTTTSQEDDKNSTSTIVKGSKNNKKNKKAYRKKTKYVAAVSAADPFVPLDVIADMTLSDVSVVFRYAIESNKENFNWNKFKKEHDISSSQHMKKVIDAIYSSTTSSRGKDVLISSSSTSSSSNSEKSSSELFGNIDALQFCAAMRIFAEWRVLRQVPDGYKAYAVGMSLGQKDVVQNLVKIENSIHNWIEHERYLAWEEQEASEHDDGGSSSDTTSDKSNNNDCNQQLRSPTLRDLLQHERDMNTHPNLPVLKERTAAIGLLWVRRQLDYQSAILTNVLEVPSNLFPTTRDAVSAAYTQIYGLLHGWAVQKIFNYSFQAAPDGEEIFKTMNPNYMKNVVLVAARRIVVVQNTEDNKRNDVDDITNSTTGTCPSNLDDDYPEEEEENKNVDDNRNPFEKLGNHIAQEWDKFGNHVGGEWDKIVTNVGNIFHRDDRKDAKQQQQKKKGKQQKKNKNHQVVGLIGDDLELYIRKEMTLDARRHSITYLDVAKPLSHDLAGLFDEFNMDDPSRV